MLVVVVLGGGDRWPATHSCMAGEPETRVNVSRRPLVGAVGVDHPADHEVSAPEPTSAEVASSQVGTSARGPPVQGVGVLAQAGSGFPPASSASAPTVSASMSPSEKPHPPAGVGEAKVNVVVDGSRRLVPSES